MMKMLSSFGIVDPVEMDCLKGSLRDPTVKYTAAKSAAVLEVLASTSI